MKLIGQPGVGQRRVACVWIDEELIDLLLALTISTTALH